MRIDRRSESQTRSAGFTLIEVLIIIVILGILAAIVVAAVINTTAESSIAACKANYKTIETAQEAYRSQVGSPATSFADLERTTTGLTQTTVGPWLREAPNTTSYTIGFDLNPGPSFGDITVTAPGHAPSDSNTNCQYAG